jgi:two-component system, LytTR family, response regulator
MSLRLVITDDEPVALAHLRQLLAAHADVQIVGQAQDGADAVDLIRHEQPDAVILDIQMPEVDGFGVLRLLADEWHGQVIFVTAYDQYAVSAFECQALDYLLKPVAPERLAQSLARLRARTGTDPQDDQRQQLMDLLAQTAAPAYLQRLAVPQLATTVVVPMGEVEWIEAEDNYVRLHCGARTHLLRGKLTGLEARLDPRHFMRVHRSHIVRLESIQRLEDWARGGLLLQLRSGDRVEVSRAHRKRLMSLLSL